MQIQDWNKNRLIYCTDRNSLRGIFSLSLSPFSFNEVGFSGQWIDANQSVNNADIALNKMTWAPKIGERRNNRASLINTTVATRSTRNVATSIIESDVTCPCVCVSVHVCVDLLYLLFTRWPARSCLCKWISSSCSPCSSAFYPHRVCKFCSIIKVIPAKNTYIV